MTKETNIFDKARLQKTYGTATLNALLEYCAEQTDTYYLQIIPLLKATKQFRNIADPGLFFTALRNAEANDIYLKQAMEAITEVFASVETQLHKSALLAAAAAYCAASIVNRLQDLAPHDKIIKLYNAG